MEYLNAMAPGLGPLYDLLKDECLALHLEWAELRVLFGTGPDRIDLLNEAAPEFFIRLHDALVERVLLQITRLVAPLRSAGRDSATLCRLPQVLDPQIRPQFEALLSVAKDRCAFAKDWRNRHIAHLDLDLALNESAKELDPFRRQNVEDSLAAIRDVLNLVELHYHDRTVAYESTNSPLGATALLDVLADGIDARKAQMERMMSAQLLPSDFAPKRPL